MRKVLAVLFATGLVFTAACGGKSKKADTMGNTGGSGSAMMEGSGSASGSDMGSGSGSAMNPCGGGGMKSPAPDPCSGGS